MSITVSQNSPENNSAITTPIVEKKSQKAKIPSKSSIKETVAKVKYSSVNNFVNDYVDIVGSIFLQSAKNQVDYKDHVLAYHYYLSLILCSFNQAELDGLFFTSLPYFYGKCVKDDENALRDAFEFAYNEVKHELITNITV